MRRSVVLGSLVAVGALSMGLAAQQQRAVLPDLQKVKDNYYIIGASGPVDRSQFTGGNVGVFVTDAGVIVVDTKLAGYGPDILAKMSAVFEAYWNNRDFEPYSREDFLARQPKGSPGTSAIYLSPIEIRLEPFQERMLEQIEICREQGRHRNLLVSATGTGGPSPESSRFGHRNRKDRHGRR